MSDLRQDNSVELLAKLECAVEACEAATRAITILDDVRDELKKARDRNQSTLDRVAVRILESSSNWAVRRVINPREVT